MSTRRVRGRRDGARGQILVLFAGFMVVVLAFGALLFSGAHALVLRRQLQNAGDAAALAAANLISGSSSCTAGRISATATDGSNDLYLAAKASVMTNLGWSAAQVASRVMVTCSTNTDYANKAVIVDLNDRAPSFFGPNAMQVTTSSTAMNGQVDSRGFSVALLDPSHTSWPANRRGCPSFLINGGITATFEGSIMVDSICLRSDNTNAAMKAQNAAFTMTVINDSVIKIAGEYALGTADHITPTPIQHARPILPDPLGGYIPPCNAIDPVVNCLGSNTSLPVVNMASTGTGICKSQDPCIITPGTYTGGIAAGSGGSAPSTVLMRPGVYVIRGGGLSLKSASARIFTIPYGDATSGYTDAQAKLDFKTNKTATEVEQEFQARCPQPTASNPNPGTCGVLIYNAPASASSNWNTNQDPVSVGAQGIFQVRAYNPTSDQIGTNRPLFASYRNLAIWQARTPEPQGSGQTQPTVSMTGGGCVTLSGTIYAPGAPVVFGGGSCGGGGGDASLTLQFIAWDLTLAGNNNFYFAYNKGWFAEPMTYGLVR